jgi:hypothetical protein
MPPLLHWLSNVFVSPFTMDVDERLRFTIIITHQSIYWSVKQTTETLSTSRRHRDPPAITGNWVAGYGIVDNPVVGYVLLAILLSVTVEISLNIRDCCMFR